MTARYLKTQKVWMLFSVSRGNKPLRRLLLSRLGLHFFFFKICIHCSSIKVYGGNAKSARSLPGMQLNRAGLKTHGYSRSRKNKNLLYDIPADPDRVTQFIGIKVFFQK